MNNFHSSHNTDSVGNIESILVAGEGHVGLLLTSCGNESVNFLDLNLVKGLHGLLNELFVGSLVYNENETVVILNGFDCRLTGQWVLDDSELIESVIVVDTVNGDLWNSLLDKGLWQSECGLMPNLSLLSGMGTLLHSG
jgi:hypothetical protein